MAGRSDVKAFNFNQGDSAAVLGPSRSRIRQVVIFGNAAGVLTIKDGNGGDTILLQSFPTGLHTLNIPDQGMLAENGAYIHGFTGSGNKLTVFLIVMATAKKRGTMKGHTISGGHKRPTKSGAGMTAKGVAKYRKG